jgi:hypothetical protein
MDIDKEIDFAKKQVEAIAEQKRKRDLNQAKQELHEAMTTGEILRKGKNKLVSRMTMMIEDDFELFQNAMHTLAVKKPGVYSKLFVEIQKNMFPVKEEKTLNVNINYEKLSDEDLADLAKGKNIREAEIVDV